MRSGDGAASADVKSYKPGELVNIHVRGLKQNLKYRGFLLNAESEVNGKVVKVGSWELPTEVLQCLTPLQATYLVRSR